MSDLYFFYFCDTVYIYILSENQQTLSTSTTQKLCHLIDMIQLRTRSATIVGLLSEPLGANFDSTSTGLAAS